MFGQPQTSALAFASGSAEPGNASSACPRASILADEPPRDIVKHDQTARTAPVQRSCLGTPGQAQAEAEVSPARCRAAVHGVARGPALGLEPTQRGTIVDMA